MMFEGVSFDTFKGLTEQEVRWLNNVKKAFHNSDSDYQRGHPEDRCIEELCKGIDTAKTLLRSIRGENTSPTQNKRKFIEFLSSDMPSPEENGFHIQLTDFRTGEPVEYSFPELIYDIRCMVHENENLNVAESPMYHIQLDWSMHPKDRCGFVRHDDHLRVNAHMLWNLMRETLAKFITTVDGLVNFHAGKPVSITIRPEICSIKPA